MTSEIKNQNITEDSTKRNNIILLKKKKKKKIKKINILKTNEDSTNKNFFELKNIYNQEKININTINIDKNNINENNLKINNYNDNELNNLSYDKALIIDKRNYIKYYISLLRRKQPIIFTFFINNDYNSKFIKISLFLFSFSFYYAINALFYTDTVMHQIHENKGKFILIYQIPKILYSTIISSIVITVITNLSLTENNILELKELTIIKKDIVNKLKKNMKIKFIIFYILNYLLLIFFWYYPSSFCCVYKNTQLHLIKDTLISYS